MNYWLMKCEPYLYSWHDLVRDKRYGWDGVRNHLAKRHLQTMQKGDQAFYYHSNEGLEIVGIMEITKTAYPDPTDETGKFVQVDVVPLKALPTPVTLKQIKQDPKLAEMILIKQSRLSVCPVTPAEWTHICKLGGL